MSFWRPLAHGLRVLFNRRAADEAVGDEVQHYFDETVDTYLARGLSREDALRAARLEVGSVAGVREQVRESGWEHPIDNLLADLRYSVRRLRATPAFTLIAVSTLALGIGATTAVFSAVRPILIDTLPYPDAGRIAMVQEVNIDGSRNEGSFGIYRELVDRTRSFEALAVLKPWRPTLTAAGEPERLNGQRVSASYFRVLGVKPVMGRDLQETDDRLQGTNAVVLSSALWRRRFGGDPGVVGRSVVLDDDTWFIAGVMPPDFENVLDPEAELWAPLQYDMSQGRAWGHHLRTVGRLKPAVTIQQASRELDVAGRDALRELRPETYADNVSFAATSLHDDLTRAVRPALLTVFGAVILVMMIACVNVTNLLLARGVNRHGEFALRAALGAGRARLIGQLLTENFVLAALGGVTGLAVAVAGVRALASLSPPDLPRSAAIVVDSALFAAGFGVTALIGLACGLMPAIQAARSEAHSSFGLRSPRVAGHHRRLRNALVVAEIALAVVLLVASGLMLRSLDRLFAVDAGFDSSQVLTMQVQASTARFNDPASMSRFFENALEAVKGVPGVTAAAFTSQLPISGDSDEYGVRFEPSRDGFSTFRYAVSPEYIEAMRIPVKRGRSLEESDRGGAPRVALISESLANRRFRGSNALGQRLRIGPLDGPLYTVVGVVGDVKQLSLARNEADAVYVPAEQWPFGDRVMSFVMRTAGDPAALAPAVRDAIWSVDREQPVVRIATMEGLVATSAAQRRFALVLFEAFALAALVLAAAGIYGVLAGNVAERTREIGVRAALGATRGRILSLVVGQGMLLTALGVVIGLAGAALASGAMASLLFGVSRLDPATYVGVVALLAGVALVACAAPAWRALRVDPASTLRAE